MLFPKQFTVGFCLRKEKAGRDMLWPRSWPLAAPHRLGRAPKPCPRFESAAPPNLVRHVPALCVLWLPLQTLAAMCRVPASPCIRLVSALAANVSAPCVFFVLSVVRSLSALCRFLAGSMVWLWPGLCQLCLLSLVFAPLSVLCPLLSALVEVFVATLLPAVRLVTFSRAVLLSTLKLRRAFALCLSFPPLSFFLCLHSVCLGFVCVCLCPDLYTGLGHALSLCSAGPRLSRLSLGLWRYMSHALLVFSMTSVFCL